MDITIEQASRHAAYMRDFIDMYYKSETVDASGKSSIIPAEEVEILYDNTDTRPNIVITNSDLQDAIVTAGNGSITVLNIGSSTRPGGAFVFGGLGAEEELCHISNLYPILLSFEKSYYEQNNQDMENRAIWSPDVLVFSKDLATSKSVNVLTTPLPSTRDIVSIEEALEFALSLAVQKKTQTLVMRVLDRDLDALDPYKLAKFIHEFIVYNYHELRNVIFSFDSASLCAMQAFENIFT